jgi:hypothetical protein
MIPISPLVVTVGHSGLQPALRVNIVSKGVEFIVHGLGKFPYGFGEDLFRDKRGRCGCVVQRFGFLSDDLPDGCMSESNSGWIRFGTINVCLMWYKSTLLPSRYVDLLLHSVYTAAFKHWI